MLIGTIVVLLQVGAATAPADFGGQREARAAQARFETTRRAHLPRNRIGGSSGPCDAQIGRYCYWYDSTDRVVVPEPRRIIEARAKLLRFLDSAATADPSDAWVAGQRVRYLIEGGHPTEAVAAARACRAAGWFCAAIEGLALHVAERYSEADSVFGIALREMPAPQRCDWLDIRSLVPRELDRELGRASCAERATLAERLWTLSRPLWSVPGNDMRTEHFARHAMALILARSMNAHGMSWGSDSRELLLRYGWSEWFTRQEDVAGAGLSASPRVTGHDREPSYHFFPEVASARGTPRIPTESWSLREPTARTRYAPRHVKRMTALPHQLARFPRGDSTLVAVAYRIIDTALARDTVSVALGVYSRGEVQHPAARVPARFARDDRGILVAMVPRDTAIVSIEALGRSSKQVSRARYTVDPLQCAGSLCVSDLLLFSPGTGSAPTAVDRALPLAATTLTFSNRDPLGAYWEVQGPGSTPVSLSLTVTPVDVGLPRRLASRLKLAPELAPVRLRWQAVLVSPLEPQHVTLRLPASARGKYRMILTIETRGAPAIVTTREIDLVP